MPRKCAACGIEKVKKQYSKNQWAKKPADSKCLHCIENGGRLQAFSPPEPNVVTGWQYHQYDSERYVYIGKDEDGEPQFLDNGPKSGHSKPQGATRGNSTETLPVLLIQGLGMFEPNDCFISNGFKNAAKEAGIAFVSVECGGHQSYQDCAKAVSEAHEKYSAIVVADLSQSFEECQEFLSSPLSKYVLEHRGCVLFPTSEGMLWCKRFLTPTFGDFIHWKADSYYRAVHRAVKGNKENISRFFGSSQMDAFSIKSAMLNNVPVLERCFSTSEGSQLFGGRFPGLTGPSEPGETDDNDDGIPTAVAVASGGALGGTVAYFGDVNSEPCTNQLMASLILQLPLDPVRASPGTSADEAPPLVSGTPHCAGCKTKGGTKRCSACHMVSYCSQTCQKDHLKTHKKDCKKDCKKPGGDAASRVLLPVFNHRELFAAAATIAGEPKLKYTVQIANGVYDTEGPFRLAGEDVIMEGVGMKRQSSSKPGEDASLNSQLEFKIIIATKNKFEMKGLTCTKGVTVGAPACHALFERVHVDGVDDDDAFVLNQCQNARLQDCEVFGGGDGLCIYDPNCSCYIKGSDIRFARSRGIFANPSFTVEDVEVSNCGGYGMKTRGGCKRVGHENDIQAGPWDGPAGGSAFGPGGPPMSEQALLNALMQGGGLGGGDASEGGYGEFTHDEVQELAEQGVKPWESDARAVLNALSDYGYDYEDDSRTDSGDSY